MALGLAGAAAAVEVAEVGEGLAEPSLAEWMIVVLV